jgi:hypothetical protein
MPAALIAFGLAAAPHGSQAQPNPAAPGQVKRAAPVTTTAAEPAKPVAVPPPTGAEVGTAVDAMGSTCSRALALSTQIEAAVARRKTSMGARMKSNLELKKKLRAVLDAQKKVERASKKPGTDAPALAEAARAEYEAALAQSKTVEVETQNVQGAQDELAKLVTAADEASVSCASYEAAIRRAATEAHKAVEEAKRGAAKAHALAAVPAPKALEATRALQAKELEANRTSTEGARTALEAMKAEAAKQPPPGAAPVKPEHAGKPEGKKAPGATEPK